MLGGRLGLYDVFGFQCDVQRINLLVKLPSRDGKHLLCLLIVVGWRVEDRGYCLSPDEVLHQSPVALEAILQQLLLHFLDCPFTLDGSGVIFMFRRHILWATFLLGIGT